MPMREKESIQFITFESMKRNFYQVFGRRHDAFAEMLFRYMSDCREDPSLGRVNYFQFLKKFEAIWPKKVEPRGRKDEAQIEQEEFLAKVKKREEDVKLSFSLLDIDGDNYLSILDLVWLSDNFGKNTKFGSAVAEIFELYMNKNVRPKFVKTKFVIDFAIF
mmetsp:Transcript_5850/g.9398  ORF Transcript_5850/g.9398 Transcript_5850/m.9398 type:complete len:162 (-) Transcript_5850:263-748(-)